MAACRLHVERGGNNVYLSIRLSIGDLTPSPWRWVSGQRSEGNERETDLHKFDNLFLNPIEHCLSIYIGIIVC